MKIKYLGPGDSVNVPPHGEHQKGTVKEYPDEFGEELLATSKRQKFVPAEIPPEDMTVPELKQELQGKEFPANAKKAELVELVKTERLKDQ